MDKKLNIFFSNSISAHKWGGGEKWMITAACGLKERGHEVTLSGKANSILLNKAQEAGLKILPLNIYADYNPFKIWYTKRILKREKVDVIMLNLNKDIRVAGIAARWAKVPVIIARNGIQLFSDKWKHKKTIELVDGIITNSESIRTAYNNFSWMPREKTTVIYNGLKMNGTIIEPADVHTIWNIPKNHLIFVAAGRLTRQKGFDLLIDATSRMNGTSRPFTVLIAGTGKDRKALEKQNMFTDIAGDKRKFEMVKGAMSAIGLYKKLYEFKDKGCVCCFDDCDAILYDDLALNLLKAALDTTPKRMLHWNTESRTLQAEGMPNHFEFNGGVIFITNNKFDNVKSKKLQDHLAALQSRCHYLDLTIDSMKDRMLRIRQICGIGMLKKYNMPEDLEEELIQFIYNHKHKLREISLRMVL